MVEEGGDEEVIGTLVTLMALEYAPYLLALERVHSAVAKVASQIELRYEHMGEASTQLARSFYTVAIATAAAAAITTYAWHHTAEAIVEAVHASERIGTSSEYVRMWSVAAVLAGQSADSFAGSVESLHRRIQELTLFPPQSLQQLLSGGNRPFTMLGISPWMLRGMDADKQIEIIAEALSHVTDKALQLQLAQELLGESGAYMLKYLKDGAAGVEELRKHFEALNLTLSEDQTKAIEESVMAWRELKLAVQGFLTQITASASPALKTLFEILGSLVQTLGWFVKTFPMLTTMIVVMAGAVLFLAAAVTTLAAALFLLQATNPILLVIGLALTAIAGAIILFVVAFKKLKEWIFGGSKTEAPTPQPVMASSSMASSETNQILSNILSTNKNQLMSQEAMVAQLKKVAPPHMAYSW
jgi:hypothetical protein